MAFRLDKGELLKARKLADGRLIAPARFTRTGVFVYRDGAGGEIREYRAPSEVFDDESMATFAMVPLTDDHPPESLDSNNARQHAVGATGEQIKRDGSHLAGTIMVLDADVIAKMEAGKVELSCGYQADVVMGEGVSPDGEHYDAVQKNIRGNHVAIVDVGRAGPTARVRMDASVMVADAAKPRSDIMDSELKKALEAAAAEKVRADAADAKLEAAEKAHADALAVVTAERDAKVAELKKVTKQRDDAAAGEPARIRARVELESSAAKVLGKDEKIADKSDRAIRVAVIKKIDAVDLDEGKTDADKKPDAYVEAYFDSAMKRASSEDAELTEVVVGAGSRADAVLFDEHAEDKARKAMLERNANAGKPVAN